MKKTFLALTLLCIQTSHIFPKLIIGDPNASTGTTFSFNVGFVKFTEQSENSLARWWTATNDATIAGLPDETKQYGLSVVNQAVSYISPSFELKALPMANPENATLYSFSGGKVVSTSAPNPIWGGIFTNFDIGSNRPIFTVASAPNILYGIQDIKRYTNSDQGANITTLLVYDFGATEEIKTIKAYGDTTYAAYAQGVFGTALSNIAILQKTLGALEDGTTQSYIRLLTTQSVDTTTATFKGGSAQPDLSALGSSIVINNVIRNVFMGIQATSAIGGTAVGLSQLLYQNNGIEIAEVVPASLVNSGIDTVLSAQNGNSIRISSVTGMLTSTNLTYVIFARDNGTGPQTIYALPTVTSGRLMGYIADFTQITTRFGVIMPIFTQRGFTTVVTDIDHINQAGPFTNQLTVGGTSTLPLDAPNSLQKMYTVGDCVYAVIGNEYTATQAPGTYKSQALFGTEGYIIGWTPWTRVLGSDSQMNYSYVSNNSLSGFYAAAGTPSATPTFNALVQTTFTTDSNLSPVLDESAQGGIQGLFDFNATTPGFNNELSMLIATSHGKVAFGQTGIEDTGIFKINPMDSNSVVTYQGANLNNHTSLVAAEIAHDVVNDYHWIFVGGASGISVLTNNNAGMTWSGDLGSIAGLCCPDSVWYKVGDFSFVKKLVWDQTYLYVLTTSALYQIALDPNKFLETPTADLNPITFIKASDLGSNVSLLDVVIDNGYMILGTTNGLFAGNGSLQKVTVPNSLPAISKIILASTSQNPQRSFTTLSNMYLLSNTFGVQQARMHRFAIQNGNIQSLPDVFAAQPGSTTQGKLTSFISFDSYISGLFYDGSWLAACSYFTGINQPENTVATPFVQQIVAGVRSGLSSSQVILRTLANYAPLNFIQSTTNLLSLIRETTSGAVIAAGDFQAHTNA